jgi:hypothetical protein
MGVGTQVCGTLVCVCVCEREVSERERRLCMNSLACEHKDLGLWSVSVKAVNSLALD